MADHGRYQVELDNDMSRISGRSNYSFYEGLIFFAAGLNTAVDHSVVFQSFDEEKMDLVTTEVWSDPALGSVPSDSSSSVMPGPTNPNAAASRG